MILYNFKISSIYFLLSKKKMTCTEFVNTEMGCIESPTLWTRVIERIQGAFVAKFNCNTPRPKMHLVAKYI